MHAVGSHELATVPAARCVPCALIAFRKLKPQQICWLDAFSSTAFQLLENNGSIQCPNLHTMCMKSAA